MVSHLDATTALSSCGGAGLVFVVGMLGINNKRGGQQRQRKNVALL